MKPSSNAPLSRRRFVGSLAGAGLAVAATPWHALAASDAPLPTRILGRTGARVTILGLGTAPVGEGPVDTPEAARIFGEVMDRGVNYIDTARIYGNAEEALGELVPSRRDRLFLVTKVWTDSGAKARESLEESLRKLKVDHVDLVHIHHIGDKNLEKVLAPDGVLAYLQREKQAGKLRFIGMTGHARPPRFLRMLETDAIDVVMPVMTPLRHQARQQERHLEGLFVVQPRIQLRPVELARDRSASVSHKEPPMHSVTLSAGEFEMHPAQMRCRHRNERRMPQSE
jgi:hypothetical protein